MKIPCKDCLLIPVCKYLDLNQLTDKCCLLDDFIEANSKRHIPNGVRLIKAEALLEVIKVFKWGTYDYSM